MELEKLMRVIATQAAGPQRERSRLACSHHFHHAQIGEATQAKRLL